MEYLNLNTLYHAGKQQTNYILLSSLSSRIWWHSAHWVTQLENEELASPPSRSPSISGLTHPLSDSIIKITDCLLSSVYFYLLLLEAFKVASNLPWSSRFHLSPCWYISIFGTRVVPPPYTSNLIFLYATIPLLSIGLWDIFQRVLHRTDSAQHWVCWGWFIGYRLCQGYTFSPYGYWYNCML